MGPEKRQALAIDHRTRTLHPEGSKQTHVSSCHDDIMARDTKEPKEKKEKGKEEKSVGARTTRSPTRRSRSSTTTTRRARSKTVSERERQREIDIENRVLLRKILEQHHGVRRECLSSMQSEKSATNKRPRTTRQINESRRERQRDYENLLLLNKIKNVKSTQDLTQALKVVKL